MAHDPGFLSNYAQAVGFGVVAGMRSQLPLALLALAAGQGRFAADATSPVSLLRSSAASRLLGLSAVGELIVDKLPSTPSRLESGPLVGRMLFGGLAGAAIAAEARRAPAIGGALGTAGAVLGAAAGYHTRAWLGETPNVPDPVWGAVEDVVAIMLGLAVLRSPLATSER